MNNNPFQNNQFDHKDIINIFKNSGIELTAEQIEKFNIYFSGLVDYNEKVNLTAITDKEEVYIKHFLDSILPINYIPNKSRLVDVGSGAGFPGLPLKIIRSDIDVTMVDSLNKRISFLDYMCVKLNLVTKNIHARAEDFAKNHFEQFDIATARAVAGMNTLLEYLLPLIKVGGMIIAYKGSNAEEELANAKTALHVFGGKVQKIIKINLPKNMGERNLIIIKKIKNTPKQYPRGKNFPKTNPII